MEASASVAPWEEVGPEEQLFVLITGANSGIGLGTGQRLIDEFLATRSLKAHLILIPTTRSASKSLLAIKALRAHAELAARTSSALRSRAGDGYCWQDAARRIHVLSPSLDLCDLRGVYAFADRLVRGTLSNPEGLEGEYLRNVRIPRLDTVVFNAAYGGWSGCNYPKAVWAILSQGLVQAVTYPNFKNSLSTSILNEQKGYGYPEKPLLGEVFCACVFGHYVLAHQLLPLLSRRSTDPPSSRGRIVWSSSIEAVADGAASTTWLALQDQASLDELQADRVKWGSSCNRHLESGVKKTEVEGWGWEGKPETDETIAADPAQCLLHKSVGRRLGTKNVTEEMLVEFEVEGARAWREMERLRLQWADILKLGKEE
ncbi:hypothetical protein BBK36DRAFT_1199012 [Trichoderma citrinoviride]|uniref:NAD(P)-binding protein n=1 Tax=Trichoderma citrinoviride TaxID=58853 RepID=A0A2T4BCA5_9HYPO|nr:hypothetical protein BBK36DRAFT_1199012 [Trichoderma citrinoviride]PTB66957.1 hypothetical protein BBK36DRAFT_1199012 [Trichoderma citrinoviride]